MAGMSALAERVARKLRDDRGPPEHCAWCTLDAATRDRLTTEAALYIRAIGKLLAGD